jgi:hypothetical protein
MILCVLVPAGVVVSLPAWVLLDATPPPGATSNRDATAPVTPAPDTVVLDADGRALVPLDAPDTVETMIDAANQLVGLPYRRGGGHRAYDEVPLDTGYDGAGAVSYALHAAGLLAAPLPAEQLGELGEPGEGAWVTIAVCAGRAHMTIAGMTFDVYPVTWSTAQEHYGTHWHRASDTPGCITRHPAGL